MRDMLIDSKQDENKIIVLHSMGLNSIISNVSSRISGNESHYGRTLKKSLVKNFRLQCACNELLHCKRHGTHLWWHY